MRRDDVTRLEAALRSANPVPRPVDLVGSTESAAVDLLVGERRDPMTSTNAPQRLRPLDVQWRRAWAFVAAFVLVLVGIGIVAFLQRDTSLPAVDDPGPAIEGITPMGPITWRKADFGEASVSVDAPVPLGSGFVWTQFGFDGTGNPISEIVVSSDGLAWSAVATKPLLDGETVAWRDGDPWGAAGEILGPDNKGLLLARDGSSFARSDPRSTLGASADNYEFKDLAVDKSRVVVVYHDPALDPQQGEVVLTGSDGETWQVVAKPEEVIVIRDVVSTPSGIFLIAEADSAEQPNPGMMMWNLTGDLTWEEVLITDEFLTYVRGPFGWRDGDLVIGGTRDDATETGTSGIWYSTDARAWSAIDMAPFEGLSVVAFAGTDRGILAFTHDDDGATFLLFSSDASTWERWSAAEVFGTGDFGWGEASSNGNRIVVPTMGPDGVDLWSGEVTGD